MSDRVDSSVLGKIGERSAPLTPPRGPTRSVRDIFQNISNFLSSRLGSAANTLVTPSALLAGAQAFQASIPNTGSIITKDVGNIAVTTFALAGFYIFLAIAIMVLLILLILAFSRVISTGLAIIAFIIAIIILFLLAYFMTQSIMNTVTNGAQKLAADVKAIWQQSGQTAANNAIDAYVAALPPRPAPIIAAT